MTTFALDDCPFFDVAERALVGASMRLVAARHPAEAALLAANLERLAHTALVIAKSPPISASLPARGARGGFSSESLVDLLCRVPDYDFDLHIPTKAVNGGHASYYDRSAALPCNTYQRQRFASPADATPTLSCTSTIRHCDGDVVDASDTISIEEVVNALAAPDAQGAFASAPVLYGVDPRPYDGVVFRMTIGGRAIEVGEPCGGRSGCTDAPAGVKALAALLQDLDTRKTASDACPQFH